MEIQVSELELQKIKDWAVDNIVEEYTEYSDLTYEHGVLDTIKWILGEGDAPNM